MAAWRRSSTVGLARRQNRGMMRLQPGRTVDELRNLVRELEMDIENFSAVNLGRDRGPLRDAYLAWLDRAERAARRLFVDVSLNQFSSDRSRDVMAGNVPDRNLFRVVETDAKAQLGWLVDRLAELDESLRPRSDMGAEGCWRAGMIRVFISHLAAKKGYASEVAAASEPLGVQGFVAHDSIEVSRQWQDEIETALRTAHVFLGLVHPGFSASPWTQQEVGWAWSREMPFFLVRLGEDPRGFPWKVQYPSMAGRSAADTAHIFHMWLSEQSGFGAMVIDRMVNDLRRATSFLAAKEAALRLEALGKLSPAVLDGIEHAYRTNNQLYPNHVGAQVVERMLKAHHRELPTE